LCLTCAHLGLEGVISYSFHRSLAQAAVGGELPLHVVQKISSHKALGSLGEYLAATDADVLAGIGSMPCRSADLCW
jgi:hypothetical protein